MQGKNIDNPLLQKWRVSTVSRAVLEKHVESFNQLINVIIEIAMDIFLCGDVIFSAKCLGIFYVLAHVGKWFEGLTFLWILTWIVFIWPRFYLEKKTDVDRVIGLVVLQINTYTALVQSKIPILQNLAGAPQPVPQEPQQSNRRKAH
eukprot:TRINITY_DN2342_c0_g2_i4.p1 TRINITY_DN2342_c0_g2~~TRINITY_DN2342_c0_g2_i4.p1  ORF type:complete len:147 (-),score=30.68 TRINITY_DN2342_c0_g2_i4:252-692(-)